MTSIETQARERERTYAKAVMARHHTPTIRTSCISPIGPSIQAQEKSVEKHADQPHRAKQIACNEAREEAWAKATGRPSLSLLVGGENAQGHAQGVYDST
jgi:hypothetical protein